jgi:hypothetical protein
MIRSSSSTTPMKRRCARRRLPTPKMQLLLLQSTLPQPPPPMPTIPLRGKNVNSDYQAPDHEAAGDNDSGGDAIEP